MTAEYKITTPRTDAAPQHPGKTIQTHDSYLERSLFFFLILDSCIVVELISTVNLGEFCYSSSLRSVMDRDSLKRHYSY